MKVEKFKIKRLLMICIFLLSVSVRAEDVYLGILDEPQMGGDVSAKIMFVKQGDQWRSAAFEFYRSGRFFLPDFSNTNWTAAYQNRSLGNIKIIDPDPEQKLINPAHYIRSKFFSVMGNPDIPKIPNTAKRFEGWNKTPENRPLVIVSKPNVADPENWQPVTADNHLKQLLYKPLRLVMGKFNAFRCPDGPFVNKSEPFHLSPGDIVIYSVYKNARNCQLVAIGLDQAKYGCDGPIRPEWRDHWFLIDGDEIDFLDQELTLVNTGDYDNDGKTELLF